MTRFDGLRCPPLDTPLIELETVNGEIVDLYNDHALNCVVLAVDVLSFVFTWISKDAPTVIRFSGVRNYCVRQPEDWEPQESDQIDHLLIRPQGQRPGVIFKAGGLEYEFDCALMALLTLEGPNRIQILDT